MHCGSPTEDVERSVSFVSIRGYEARPWVEGVFRAAPLLFDGIPDAARACVLKCLCLVTIRLRFVSNCWLSDDAILWVRGA